MSSNAYMLVYTEATQTEEQDSAEKKSNETGEKTGMEWILPEQLSALVKTEDQKFEDWLKDVNETKVFNWRNLAFTNISHFSNVINIRKPFTSFNHFTVINMTVTPRGKSRSISLSFWTSLIS
jgi:beta-glucanase (GH16 family)